MPATYQVNGRQFVVLSVAQATGTFPATFGNAGAAPVGPPAGAGGRQGRGGGGPVLPGAYIAFGAAAIAEVPPGLPAIRSPEGLCRASLGESDAVVDEERAVLVVAVRAVVAVVTEGVADVQQAAVR